MPRYWLTLLCGAASPRRSDVSCNMGPHLDIGSGHRQGSTQSWEEGQAPGSNHMDKARKKSCDFGCQRQPQLKYIEIFRDSDNYTTTLRKNKQRSSIFHPLNTTETWYNTQVQHHGTSIF